VRGYDVGTGSECVLQIVKNHPIMWKRPSCYNGFTVALYGDVDDRDVGIYLAESEKQSRMCMSTPKKDRLSMPTSFPKENSSTSPTSSANVRPTHQQQQQGKKGRKINELAFCCCCGPLTNYQAHFRSWV
jgi:hypothetical protein